MGLFRKKKKPEKPKMDFSGYDIILSIKAICMYERLSNKSFFDFSEDDMLLLLYCSFYVSNKVEIKYEAFVNMLENESIAKWALEKYKNILDVIQQFKKVDEQTKEQIQGEEENNINMTDMATSLIIDYHLDAHYVMYEMKMWEIEPMYRACDSMVKRKYEEQRLWTYLDILPHIDGKKIKGPTDFLPFPWEETKADRAKMDLEKNSAAAMAFLTRQNGKG